MIMTLNVTLVEGYRFEGQWAATIELDESSTLVQLHLAIQKAVKFDNEHSFSFYYSRTIRRAREYIHDDEEGILKPLTEVFPLPPKMSLFYLFDWSHSWIFRISRTRKRPHEPVARVAYPRVVSKSGTRPKQYRDFDF